MNYKNMWRKLEKKLIYANDNAHPRFKHMGEKPTIQISRVLKFMNEFETDQERNLSKNGNGHRKKSAIRPKPTSKHQLVLKYNS